jgi:T-complex protein 1 subunit zeta
VKGPNDYSIAQTRDAIRDGLRAVKNTIEDKCIVPGAGSFEIACAEHLQNHARTVVSGKVKLGVQAFADALLIVPRTLA